MGREAAEPWLQLLAVLGPREGSDQRLARLTCAWAVSPPAMKSQ